MAIHFTQTHKEFSSLMNNVLSPKEIRHLNHKNTRQDERLQTVLNTVCEQARNDIVSYDFYIAADGIRWAINSDRVASPMVLKLRAMQVNDLLAFIYEVSKQVSTIGDVAYYLNRLARQESNA